MRIICYILILLLAGSKLKAQNLVPNPGFELYNSCSGAFVNSTLENTQSWFNAVGNIVSVDWYNTCFCPLNTFYCPPNLYFGNSMPNTDNAMIGLAPHSEVTLKGESLGIKLKEPLVKDSAYCLNLWLKNSQNHGAIYTMEEFNVAFVIDTVGIATKDDVGSYEIISNINEINGWNSISCFYIAKGGEEFMLFGIFDQNPKYKLKTPQTFEKYMYYYFDDFALYQCSKDSLLSVICELPNVLTPNQDGYNDLYELKLNNIQKLDIQILNRWGNVVKAYDGIKEVWDGRDQSGTPLTDGIYYVKAIGESTFGDPISKYQFVHLIR